MPVLITTKPLNLHTASTRKNAATNGGVDFILWVLLLVHRRPARSRRDRDRSLQLECNDRFWFQDDLLALGGCGNTGSGACARCRADGCAFTAAKDSAQHRAYSCATADLRRRRFAPPIA